MGARSTATEIRALLEPRAAEHGFELVNVEVAGGDRRPVVKVFLDREGGIDIDAIASANAWIAETIERDDALPRPYTLEVSSPGVDRPLTKLADFERFAGEDAVVRTSEPLEGRSRFTGRIEAVDGDIVVLDCDGATYRIPHSTVAKARLKAHIDFGQGRG